MHVSKPPHALADSRMGRHRSLVVGVVGGQSPDVLDDARRLRSEAIRVHILFFGPRDRVGLDPRLLQVSESLHVRRQQRSQAGVVDDVAPTDLLFLHCPLHHASAARQNAARHVVHLGELRSNDLFDRSAMRALVGRPPQEVRQRLAHERGSVRARRRHQADSRRARRRRQADSRRAKRQHRANSRRRISRANMPRRRRARVAPTQSLHRPIPCVCVHGVLHDQEHEAGEMLDRVAWPLAPAAWRPFF